MSAAGDRRILLVVDPAIGDTRVVDASVRAVAGREASEVFVVAPLFTSRVAWVSNDDADGIAEAELRLAAVLEQLYALEIDSVGAVGGDVSVITAIEDALAVFPADEIIVALHTDHDGHWREHGVAAQIRVRHSQPLIELLVAADGTSNERRGDPVGVA